MYYVLMNVIIKCYHHHLKLVMTVICSQIRVTFLMYIQAYCYKCSTAILCQKINYSKIKYWIRPGGQTNSSVILMIL